jgi:TonB family protein
MSVVTIPCELNKDMQLKTAIEGFCPVANEALNLPAQKVKFGVATFRTSRIFNVVVSFLCHFGLVFAALTVETPLSYSVNELPAIQIESVVELNISKNIEPVEYKNATNQPDIVQQKDQAMDEQPSIKNPAIFVRVKIASISSEIAEEIIRPTILKTVTEKQALTVKQPKFMRKKQPAQDEKQSQTRLEIRGEREREQQRQEAQFERKKRLNAKLASKIHVTETHESTKRQSVAANKKDRVEQRRVYLENRALEKSSDNRMTHGAYASLVSAQINAHKVYPSAAREQGVSGVVNIAFTIGRAGRVSNAIVTKSSGSSILDLSAKQAVLSIALPPPPDGIFNSAVPIRYGLR